MNLKRNNQSIYKLILQSCAIIIFLSIVGVTFIVYAMTQDTKTSEDIEEPNSCSVLSAKSTEMVYMIPTTKEIDNILASRSEKVNTITKEPEIINYGTGYTTCKVNIRESPSTDGSVLDILSFNTEVQFRSYNDEWNEIKLSDKVAYIAKPYISTEPISYTSYTLSSSGFKSFMPYTTITSKNSDQYKIQHNYAYTGNYGIRQVDGRYCIAVGSAVPNRMGTYVDLILENETVIPCILADQKADKDTCSDNLTTAENGCVSEFLIDSSQLVHSIKQSGNISSATPDWNSPVVEIRVYDSMNIFD